MENTIQGVAVHDFKHPMYQDLIRSKVAAIMEKGKANVANGIREIQAEFMGREDLVVRPKALEFDVDEKGIFPVVLAAEDRIRRQNDLRLNLTGYAQDQLLERARIPKIFYDRLQDLGEHGLMRHNLMELLPKTSPEGILIRHINGTAKGVLSTAYRRVDASPVIEAFFTATIGAGYVPYRANNTATRYAVTLARPVIYTPMINPDGKPEVILMGLQVTTSDYGKGALNLNLVILRIWCANLAYGNNVLRQIHLGRRIEGEGDVIELSRRTIELDTRATASAIRDVVKGADKQFDALAVRIQGAAEKEVDINKAIADLRKKGMGKETTDKVKILFETEQPVETLPAGGSAWRLSNVLSLLANTATGDEQLDLQEAAFAAIGVPEKLVA
jgi:hypothetical protein